MAAKFDVASSVTGAGVTSLTTPSFTIATAPNRAGVVAVSFSANTPSSITASIGGVAGALITGSDSGTAQAVRSLAFGVVDPPTGSRTGTMSWTTAVDAVVGVLIANGAGPITPFVGGTANGSSTTASATATAVAGDLTCAAVAANATLTAATQTEQWNAAVGAITGAGSTDTGPGGSVTHQWTVGASTAWAVSTARIVAAVFVVTSGLRRSGRHSLWPSPALSPRKPGPGAVIDWEHPLTKSLRFYAPLNDLQGPPGTRIGRARMYDFVSKGYLELESTAFTTVTTSRNFDLGPALNFILGTPNERFLGPADVGVANITTGGLTVVAKVQQSGAAGVANGTGILTKGPSTRGTGYGIAGAQAGGFLAFASDGSVRTATTVGIYLGGWCTVMGRWWRGTVQVLVYDGTGRLLESVTATAGASITDGGQIVMGGYNNTGASNMFIGDIEWVGIWGDVLDLSACAALAASPYAILSPARARIRFFLPPVIGGGLLVHPGMNRRVTPAGIVG